MGGDMKKGDPMDLIMGAGLQCMEAATLGMPFEVWKTRQGANPNENFITSFKEVWATGGPAAFWRGAGAKQMESATKGAVLMYSKEFILDMCESYGMDRHSTTAGVIGGGGGGVCQTITIAPFTLVVTYKVKNPTTPLGTFGILRELGIRKCYGSALPVALRQGSNWALRQALAAFISGNYKAYKGGPLNIPEKIGCGIVGGALACVNQPFEILRIMVQARQSKGEANITTWNTAQLIHKNYGLRGFYTGLIPRMGLSAWQTLFMVTLADMVKEEYKGWKKANGRQ